MASIRLFHSQIEAGRLPNVCICCGAPATLTRRHKFWRAPFTGAMTARHYLAGTTWSHIRGLEKRGFIVPLCEQHRHRLMLPLYLIFGGFGLLFLCAASFVVGVCGGLFVPGLGWLLLVSGLCFIGLFVCGIAIAVVRMKTPQYSDITDQYIELTCVSEHFAAAAQAFGSQRTDSASLGEGLTKGYLIYGIASGAIGLVVIGLMIAFLVFGGFFARRGNPAAANPPVNGRPDLGRQPQPANGNLAERRQIKNSRNSTPPPPPAERPKVADHVPLLRIDFERNGYAGGDGKTMVVQDRSGRKFHGTLKGASQPQLVAGQVGDAMEFDGKDDLIVIPGLRDQLASGTKQVTVAAWVDIRKESGVGFIFNVGYHGGSEVALYHRDEDIRFALAAKHGGATLSVPREKGAGWQHLVGVWDGHELRLYVDGQLAASEPTTVAALDGKTLRREKAHVGTTAKTFFRSGRFFQGAIDELLLLPRALSDADVQDLFQRGREGTPTPTFETPPTF